MTKTIQCPTPWCSHEDEPHIWQSITDRYCILCPSCNVEGPYRETEEDAVDAWNDRGAA